MAVHRRELVIIADDTFISLPVPCAVVTRCVLRVAFTAARSPLRKTSTKRRCSAQGPDRTPPPGGKHPRAAGQALASRLGGAAARRAALSESEAAVAAQAHDLPLQRRQSLDGAAEHLRFLPPDDFT